MIRIAIDPGVSGGVAWRYADGAVGAAPMPDTPAGLAALIRTLPGPKEAIVEQVASRPGQGVASAFTFGQGVGVILGVLAALEVPVRMETPQSWQKRIPGTPSKPALDLPASLTPNQIEKARKDAADRHKKVRKQYYKEHVQRLYPHLKVTLLTADALAILSAWPGAAAPGLSLDEFLGGRG